MTLPENPICVAVDSADLPRAVALAGKLSDSVGMIKLGMEFFYACGLDGYEQVAAIGLPVFVDLKLHDIPNTVAAGLSSLMRLSPAPVIVNVHATGGPGMLKAAARAVDGRCKLIAVTILTSLDNDDLTAVGLDERPSNQHAASLARLALECGLDGVVCSPHDLKDIRKACGNDFLTVVPGIRPADASRHDQKRIATPRQAISAGADILVIGRAITGAGDPAAAARQISASLAGTA